MPPKVGIEKAAAVSDTAAEFEKLYADEHIDLIAQYGIKQAPTLVVIANGKVEKHANLSNIKAFTEKVK